MMIGQAHIILYMLRDKINNKKEKRYENFGGNSSL